MGLSIETIERRDRYIYISVTGSFNLDDAKSLFSEVMVASKEFELNKVLIDYRQIHGPVTISSRYDYIGHAADAASGKLKLAYVPPESLFLDDNFSENVARNRSLNVKITKSLDEAIAWLCDEPSEDQTP